MTFEQILNQYLELKIADGTFILADLVGINEEHQVGEGLVVVKYFNDSITKTIALQYDGTTVTHIFIQNPTQTTSEQQTKELLDKVIMLQNDNLPKSNDTTYITEKTKVIIDAWKHIIENTNIPVDNDIKEGLKYIDQQENGLTQQQIDQRKKVVDWIYKLNTRNRIEVEVGDSYDLIADLSKRISMLERLVMRLAGEILSGTPMPEAYSTTYLQIVESYLYAVDNNLFVDRTDLEDSAELFNRLMARFGTITQIVKEEYFDRK